MNAQEIFKKVRKIEIKTRGLSNQIFSGHYHSSFKGRGMAFSEVREYQYGDDVRSIDWNVTARFNHPFVKIFEEERELTVMLLIDVSGSNEFGTKSSLKEDLITEIAAVIAFSAIQNNDKVGVIFFSSKIEKFIPPKKGTSHILRIIRELVDFKTENQGTDISESLKFLTNAIKKKCTAFIVSDFLDKDFGNALQIANSKHDMIAVRIYDPREVDMPNIGMAKFKDAESGKNLWVDTSNPKTRQIYKEWFANNEKHVKWLFAKSGVDSAHIRTDEDYVKPLVNMFKKRESRF
ncbi:MAG TPA: DUF58 domain-containing protein [Bacteroidales bacterium]|nr:DUF58 domain-containing protein [Bacteroidales bacterium]HPR58082.1 DUF58 domain-containing protein [Bacteroidales bacterium]